MNSSRIVEAVLFASETPLRADEIARADESLDEDRVEEAIQSLRVAYDEADRAFHLVELGEGYQILTRPEFSTYLERFDTVPKPSRLSGPALETLAIVAYRQPITRVEVEYIRGVSSSGVLRTLEDRELIEVVGRDEGLGRPYLYGTTETFLNHFGFRSLEELPRPEELPVVLRDPQPLEEEHDDEGDDPGQGATPDADDAPDDQAPDGSAPEDQEPSIEESVSRVLDAAGGEPPEALEDARSAASGEGVPPESARARAPEDAPTSVPDEDPTEGG